MIELTPAGYALATNPAMPHIITRLSLGEGRENVKCSCGRLAVTIEMYQLNDTINTHLNTEAVRSVN